MISTLTHIYNTMDKKLEQWLKEQEAIKAKKREEHLIELGLTDDSKTVEKTAYYTVDGTALTEEEAKEHSKSGLRVIEKTEKCPGPMQVSDEEYELICRYSPEVAKSSSNEPSEKEYLRRIAKSTKTVSTILVIYVILSMIVGLIIGLSVGGSL